MIPRLPRLPIALSLLLVVGLSCRQAPRTPELRLITDNLSFRVSTDPRPPFAREPIVYRLIVSDRQTRQPVEGGIGQIFARSADDVRIWDGLTPGPELGSYYATLNFITAGEWAIGLLFQPDSLRPVERLDWMQHVRNARAEPGAF